MSFHGTIHSAEVIRKGHTLDEYKTVLDLYICMGYAPAGENDEHICAVFPDGITTEIGFAMFQMDLEILCKAGFCGEVILEVDILQLTKYKLTDDGVVKLGGEIVYKADDQITIALGSVKERETSFPEQSMCLAVENVDASLLEVQYRWLLDAVYMPLFCANKVPDELEGLIHLLESMLDTIQSRLDAQDEQYPDIFKYLNGADGDEWYPERIEALKADKRTLQRLDIAYRKACEHMESDEAMDHALWKVIGRKEQDTDWRLLKEPG